MRLVPKEMQNNCPKPSKNQGHAVSFLWLSWCCPLWIPIAGPNCQQEILFECYISFAWSYSQEGAGFIERQHPSPYCAVSHDIDSSWVLRQKITHIVPQSRYSCGVTPRDSWLFPKLKKRPWENRFEPISKNWTWIATQYDFLLRGMEKNGISE